MLVLTKTLKMMIFSESWGLPWNHEGSTDPTLLCPFFKEIQIEAARGWRWLGNSHYSTAYHHPHTCGDQVFCSRPAAHLRHSAVGMKAGKLCPSRFLPASFLLSTPKGCISNQWFTMAYLCKNPSGKLRDSPQGDVLYTSFLPCEHVLYTVCCNFYPMSRLSQSHLWMTPTPTCLVSTSPLRPSHVSCFLNFIITYVSCQPFTFSVYQAELIYLSQTCSSSCVLYFFFNHHHFSWHTNPGSIWLLPLPAH